MKWHKTLTEEKWKKFPEQKQFLMINNELRRAQHWLVRDNPKSMRQSLERAFELIDLTINVSSSAKIKKELLQLRESIGQAYIKKPEPSELQLFQNFVYHLANI
ncbi:MAG: hypothetical protein ABID45_03910 [Patescibacteria group bacterium]